MTTTTPVIQRPERARMIPERRCVELTFRGGERARFHMVGGVSWPFGELYGERISMRGYAVLCGYNVESRVVTVFENTPFMGVDATMDARTGEMRDAGLVQWLNRNWGLYQARRYWWHEAGVLNERYRREIRANVMIQPKPVLVQSRWADDGSPEQVLWALTQEGRLVVPPSLASEIRVAEGDKKVPTAGRHALTCALMGMVQRPWRGGETEW